MNYDSAKKYLSIFERLIINDNVSKFEIYENIQKLTVIHEIKKYKKESISYLGQFLTQDSIFREETRSLKKEDCEEIWISLFNILRFEFAFNSDNQPSIFDNLKDWIAWSFSLKE
jgi:hypothetical protein